MKPQFTIVVPEANFHPASGKGTEVYFDGRKIERVRRVESVGSFEKDGLRVSRITIEVLEEVLIVHEAPR